jgi:hypothetical protein
MGDHLLQTDGIARGDVGGAAISPALAFCYTVYDEERGNDLEYRRE